MGLLKRRLGIDLGTAYTLVYVPGKGIVLNEPSVVAISEQENRVLAIGAEAREMIGRTPGDIVAYRPMRAGVIADYRVTEAMLRHYFQKTLGRWSFFKPDVLISVPAGVTSTERRAVIEAAIKAGAKQAHVAKEPILAAIGAGLPIYEAQGHMIVDIGAGTTDAAVISLGGIVASASIKVGGEELDHAIVDFIKKKFNLAIGDKTAEKVKIKIGSAVPLQEELKIMIKGRDYVTGLPRSVKLTSNELVQALDDVLRKMIQAIKDALQETPPELAADIIDNGITLTGGSAQLRNLPDLIYRRTGVKAVVAEDPTYCVVRGTGLMLDHLDTYKRAVLTKKR